MLADGSPASVNPPSPSEMPLYAMSVPAATRFRQATGESHGVPVVVTPLIWAAMACGSVLRAICAASALMTTASYVSPAYDSSFRVGVDAAQPVLEVLAQAGQRRRALHADDAVGVVDQQVADRVEHVAVGAVEPDHPGRQLQRVIRCLRLAGAAGQGRQSGGRGDGRRRRARCGA